MLSLSSKGEAVVVPVRVGRTELGVYWRLVEYLAGKDGRLMSDVHSELHRFGLAPWGAKFKRAWDEPRPPGAPSRFSAFVLRPPDRPRRKGAGRVSRSS